MTMSHGAYPTHSRSARLILAAALLLTAHSGLTAESRRLQVSDSVLERTARGEPVEVLVLLDAGAEMRELAGVAPAPVRPGELRGADYGRYISERARLLRGLKRGVLAQLASRDVEPLSDYDLLPVLHLRIRNARALDNLTAQRNVLSIDAIRHVRPMLAQSLALVDQPAVQSAGHTGTGATVCVLDTGTDYTRAAFGSCTAPGAPGGCKVVAAVEAAADDGMRDDPDTGLHGTNVAAVVLGVAPDARVAAVDVFSGGNASSSDILGGINWCIANRATYNIVAINLSLGGGRYYSALPPLDAIGNAIQTALDAGIITVAASGNEGYIDSLAWPAAYTNVISVGAVYDSGYGTINYGLCSDNSASDAVACFSNSAPFLSVLAPGASIHAAEIAKSGTSQAAPHVAGAAALLAAAYPSESVGARMTRLLQGVTVTDARNGVTKTRLHLPTALAATDPEPTPEPSVGTCATEDCRESYGGWRTGLGLR